MTYAIQPTAVAAGPLCPAAPAARGRPAKGPLRRILNAIRRSRQQTANKESERFFARSGRVLTDDVERRMTQSLIGDDWRTR
jgi:hypothetical protein